MSFGPEFSPVVVDATVSRGDFVLTLRTSFAPGTVTAVLGPNGAGKSTLLRTLAGLQAVDTGSVSVGGRVVDAEGGVFVPPQERSVGVVFQDYALFPHLSVLDNVAFGPRSRGKGRAESRERARVTLARLGIGDLAARRPAQVSGGQAQRVALGRALATEPELLLLDEPLAALDAETREAVRIELDEQLSAFTGCVVIVTHDPLDAMLLADRVIVLEHGQVVQDAPPADIARRPATAYTAALMGVTLLRGSVSAGVLTVDGGGTLHVADTELEGRALAVLRPEAISLHRSAPEGSPRNVWPGVVASVQPSHDRVRVLVDAAPSVVVAVTPAAVAELGLAKGSAVWMSLKAVEIDVYASPSH
jgi:molybdate transport system ATP-binding protein